MKKKIVHLFIIGGKKSGDFVLIAFNSECQRERGREGVCRYSSSSSPGGSINLKGGRRSTPFLMPTLQVSAEMGGKREKKGCHSCVL